LPQLEKLEKLNFQTTVQSLGQTRKTLGEEKLDKKENPIKILKLYLTWFPSTRKKEQSTGNRCRFHQHFTREFFV